MNRAAVALVLILLWLLGIVALAYPGINFKMPGKPTEFLGLHIETTHSHFIPPFVRGLALVGGVALPVVEPKQV